MSLRIKKQEVSRRTVTPQRLSDSPSLRVLADLDSSRGFGAIGAAAGEVFGKLGQVAQRATAERTAQKFTEDQQQGAKDRTVEVVAGTEVQPAQTLAQQTDGYRRGYYLSEAANRIHATKLALAKETAGLRPGEDVTPIMQQRMAEMLQAPEFQDPAILREMQPAIQRMQEGVIEFRQKNELAEIFDSQSENLRQLARDGVQDGSLLTPAGVNNFRAALNTEAFAYLDDNDADDILSAAYVDLIESGQIDPENAKTALQQPMGTDAAALWDREGWGEKFETAVAAGASIRARQFEEAQAEMLSGMEYQLQGRAAKGQLAIGDINALADKVGMQGKDRLSFVRRWIDQNDAGLKHMQSEANRAKEHRETIAAINAGNALSLTDSQLSKSAQTEWAAVVATGDRKKMTEVITRYTRAGIIIPQLKDLLGRTTSRNLTANYILYSELAKIDPIAADRYLSEENATLFAQHHDNVTRFGMSPQESIQALPTGATKGRRADVVRDIAQASARYYKDNPQMPNGSDRPRQMHAQIEQEAVRLALANPNAAPADNLRVAERRVLGSMIFANGRWVPIGPARPGTERAIEAFTKAAVDRAVQSGFLRPEEARGAYAAPHPEAPGRFIVLMSNGFPVPGGSKGEVLGFRPIEGAALLHEYETERAIATVRRNQEIKSRLRVDPGTPAFGAVETVGVLEQMADDQAAAAKRATDAATTEPLPEFLEWVQGYRRQQRAERQNPQQP